MASTTPSLRFTLLPNSPAAPFPNFRRLSTVRCGPRDNRPPIHKGRMLSTEAIHAIQSLKRAHRTDPTNLPTHLLHRLVKSDLVAATTELLRQDQCALAAKVFAALRTEYGAADMRAYAEMAAALARNGLAEEIDPLIVELENSGGGIRQEEKKGVLALVKAVIGAGRRESTVRIYGMMKRSGYEIDEYMGRVMSKGLRRLGEGALAEEVDREFGRIHMGSSVNSRA